MPKSSIGIKNDKLFTLKPTGKVAVELNRDVGIPLAIAGEKPSFIKLPIASSVINVAPSGIDSWIVDDKKSLKKKYV